MKIPFLYDQKVIFIKEKKEKNVEKIFNIFNASIEKYKNYLSFIGKEKYKEDDIYLNKKSCKDIKNPNIYTVENKNRIKIKYNISENDNKVRIFGDSFVKNNKNICYIINNGKKYYLNNYFNIKK